jgi:hypothetical protein
MRIHGKLIIWTGKKFVVEQRTAIRRPGSFNDRYIGTVCQIMRKAGK